MKTHTPTLSYYMQVPPKSIEAVTSALGRRRTVSQWAWKTLHFGVDHDR